MSIGAYLAGRSFDPEMIAILDDAFEGVCADLAVTKNLRCSRETVAKKVLELADSQRDPEALRAAVIAFLTSRH